MANLLLERMSDLVRSELLEAGSPFAFSAGENIPADSLRGSWVFVVDGGIASKFVRSDAGKLSLVAMVGREGLFPLCALLNVPTSPRFIIAQSGHLSGLRIRSREFHSIVAQSDDAALLVRKYCYALLTQTSSNILNSEHNGITPRLARWLLMCHDRIDDEIIHITHDTLAQMAFAHRPTITNVLHGMRDGGLIAISRGQIRILSRGGLIKLAEGAYGAFERYWREHIGPFGRDASNLDYRQVALT